MASLSIVNEVLDEEFGEVYQLQPNSIEVAVNRRACATLQTKMFPCALGKRNYSSGVHRIRLRVDRGKAVLGIRSRAVAVPAGDEFVDVRLDGQQTPHHQWRILHTQGATEGIEHISGIRADVELRRTPGGYYRCECQPTGRNECGPRTRPAALVFVCRTADEGK